MALTCTGGVLTVENGSLACSGTWEDIPVDFSAITQLNETLELFLVFDSGMFFLVLGALISAFFTGWVGGLIARVIMKTG
jgi:hypothetical protein